ncbi:hypothetical protein [Humibacillus xanthopallidus]|uniref:Zn-dependent protease with chaperone function n=1 Tax=Humibacillus xanthopallidus TaxID=412689 RepID=A0A543HZL1_9MICO|nr:hypothetical protein [Humibacillus xanthopallidus]TQM63787.1 hypothetical protein FBY41_0139 [Humibacillus xanthopallidus]
MGGHWAYGRKPGGRLLTISQISTDRAALSLGMGVGVMGVPLTRVLAQTPRLAVSTVVTAALAALLPGPIGWLLFLSVLCLGLALLAGAGEHAAVRWLFGARALTPAEAAALAPAIVLLCQRGLGPPLVRLYLWPGGRTVSASGAGRRSVLVSAELVSQVRLGRLPADQAAAVIAHAAALVGVGAVRSELGMRLWTTPWRFLRGLARTVGTAGGRLPLVALMWRARFVVALVALGQGVSSGQLEAVMAGALSAAVVALSYLAPRWEKAWASGLQALGDEQVARAGLAVALADFLLRQSRSAATFERVHALELAHASLQPPSPPVRATRR